MPKLSLKVLNEFRDHTISCYNAQIPRFRLTGMDRDLTEDEKIVLARLDACILTLNSLHPDIVNMALFNSVFDHRGVFLPDCYDSVFDD